MTVSRNRVLFIFLGSSAAKMFWINTGWSIASMPHVKSRRNWAFVKRVSYSVCTEYITTRAYFSVA